jgi:hypothetical protein|tara:strand:+ start:2422 stop:2610 length:189 start_codon:yes stop_codon:yes gene_type:complete
MDLFPEAQTFQDGLMVATKHKVVEEYIQVFLTTYRLTGDIKYSKNNALAQAMHERDTEIMEL